MVVKGAPDVYFMTADYLNFKVQSLKFKMEK